MERYWSKVNKDGPVAAHMSTPCWVWLAARDRSGYGVFYLEGSYVQAHRLVFFWENDEVPEGLCVLHRCDVRHCVNPEHLFVGTKTDNMLDKVSKERQTRGEAVNTAKLTPEQIREIRKDPRLPRVIAEDYPVGPRALWSIKKRMTWKHIE